MENLIRTERGFGFGEADVPRGDHARAGGGLGHGGQDSGPGLFGGAQHVLRGREPGRGGGGQVPPSVSENRVPSVLQRPQLQRLQRAPGLPPRGRGPGLVPLPLVPTRLHHPGALLLRPTLAIQGSGRGNKGRIFYAGEGDHDVFDAYEGDQAREGDESKVRDEGGA